ncbi:MAG TPA: type 1 glutamine amidotransferase domain-containing protein [Casimicrobiaceae bacterium]|nr:type 1 glutamine amidotransferase domain-containing protein [Casimicrobiaceae bacterium]
MAKQAQKRTGAPLRGQTVAILATHGFEEDELLEPRKALEAAGARTVVIGPEQGKIRGWKAGNWADEVPVDVSLDDARAHDYSALMLPGGVLNPDRLRTDQRAVAFVRSFFEHSKPVAAICHGPIMLIEANVLKGRRVTSWPSLKTDVGNAGGRWADEAVVVDRGLVTSRKPADIPAFNERMIEEFVEASPASQQDRSTIEL